MWKPVVYRSQNGYDVKEASDAATIPADQQGESLTVQSQTEDADLNVMLKRFGVIGVLSQNVRVPTYGDFTGVRDYQTAVNAIVLAQESFMAMPADVRMRFSNDPQKFLEFTSNKDNLEEMRKLGLAVPKVEPAGPMKVEVVNPVAPVAPKV